MSTVKKIITKYDFHDIANIYPLANEKEFELLKSSIKDIGQEHPIIIYKGKILDGRNRYKACLELGIEPKIKEFFGTIDEAIKYANELNSGRRHTNKSQQAMVAANLVLESREDKSKTKISVETASLMFAVSKKYINRAMAIKERSKVMAQNIFDGKLSIYNAETNLNEMDSLDSTKKVLESSTSSDDYSVEEIQAFKKAMELYSSLSPSKLRQRLYQCEKSKSGY